MYFYYMVSAMGPKYQKFLWWKKYLTTIQMVSSFGKELVSARYERRDATGQLGYLFETGSFIGLHLYS